MGILFADFLGNTFACDCLGCAIANHSISVPGGLIFEDDMFSIQQDPLIPIKGFMIVNVKEHISSITQLDDLARIKLLNLISDTISFMKELGVTDKIIMVQEERSKHFHVWLFPYHSWMINDYEFRVENLRKICDYAKEKITDKEINEILEMIDQLRNKFVERGYC